MRRINQWFIVLLMVLLLMAGCAQQPQENGVVNGMPPPAAVLPQADADQPPTVLRELAKLSPEEENWLNLAKEQMLESVEYLHRVLVENFPYFNVIQRKTGIDMEAQYAACLKETEAAQTDAQFYVALSHWLGKADDLEHLMLMEPGMYETVVPLYQEAAEQFDVVYGMSLQWLANVYNNEATKASYSGLTKVMEPLFNRVGARP